MDGDEKGQLSLETARIGELHEASVYGQDKIPQLLHNPKISQVICMNFTAISSMQLPRNSLLKISEFLQTFF